MRFDRDYDLYAFLGLPGATLPWIAGSWKTIAAALNPLVLAARDRAAVRTLQLDPGPKGRPLSFGRIGWNKRGAAKWVHATEGALLSGFPARFNHCEAWAPSWSACERDGLSPDVYFAMRDHPAWTWSKTPLAFRDCGFLAVAKDLHLPRGDQVRGDQIRGIAAAVASVFEAVLFALCTRAWGEPFGDIGFSNATNYLQAVALLGRGAPDETLSLSALEGNWEAI